MAAQRDEQCIGILFSFHFLSITIDVLEPGTDLVKRIYSSLDGTRAAFIFAEYLFFYHYRSHLITRVNEKLDTDTRNDAYPSTFSPLFLSFSIYLKNDRVTDIDFSIQFSETG